MSKSFLLAFLQTLRRIPQHALSLLEALEAVVEGELAADDVELDVRVFLVEIFEALLRAVRSNELGREDALLSVSASSVLVR